MSNASVAILLCTYNGAQFLAKQLASFTAQTHANWQLWVSDDGSTDETHAILADFAASYPERVRVVQAGPQRGFAHNFLNLLQRDDIEADYFAYADQDDIWYPERLSRGLHALSDIPNKQPKLYCSRTQYIDGDDQPIGMSKLFTRSPSFPNALVQCIAGGNTMLFDKEARRLLNAADPTCAMSSHDWFTYLAVTATGGQVIYDPVPTVSYRQHRDSLAGGNRGVRASLWRASRLFRGDFKHWNDVNIAALQPLLTFFTPENKRRFDAFVCARHQNLPGRLRSLLRAGVYRQTLLGNIGILVATLNKKI